MNKSRRTNLLALAIAASFGLAASAYAADANVSADTYITAGAANSNFGTAVNLNVVGGATPSSGLVKFDLSNLPADSSLITKATMVLFVNKVNAAGGIDVKLLASSWSEASVNNNTAPSVSGPIAVGGVNVPLVQGQYVMVDITAEVKNWINTPANNFGLMISGASATPPSTPSSTLKKISRPVTRLLLTSNSSALLVRRVPPG
jgi:hypothetical protein